MGVLTLIRGSKNLDDLSFVKGIITDSRTIKHTQVGKYRTRIKEVLVLKIEGSNDEFGFMQSTKAFNKLQNRRRFGKTAEIYYDAKGKRIEQNVTLHTFDLTVANEKIVEIEEIKKSERLGSVFFFIATLILILIAWRVIWLHSKNEQP
jgi:hypothetical protein